MLVTMAHWQFPAEGEILAEKYRIDRVLGQGGMGLVVSATHVHLDQRVAIKFLLPEATEHPEIVERFAREARAAARMQGRNVVRVIDVGTLEDGRTFMVMEYLEGKDLEKLLEESGGLPVAEVAQYVMEALEALAEAHAKGIVHRDLKPGNLFLASQPDGGVVVKVLDFGISKLQDDRAALTKTSTAMGTAFYMSPEQLTNAKDVDERADVWSIGVLLYELVSNARPFDGTTMPEIVAKILRNNRKPLVEYGRDIPAEFDAVIGRCLASERSDRFQDVGELAEALAPFYGPGGVEAADRVLRVRGRRSQPPSRVLNGPISRAYSSPSSERAVSAATQLAVATSHAETGPNASARPRSRWVAPLVGVVVLAAGGLYMAQKNGAASTQVSDPSPQNLPPSEPSVAAKPPEPLVEPPPATTASNEPLPEVHDAGAPAPAVVSTAGRGQRSPRGTKPAGDKQPPADKPAAEEANPLKNFGMK